MLLFCSVVLKNFPFYYFHYSPVYDLLFTDKTDKILNPQLQWLKMCRLDMCSVLKLCRILEDPDLVLGLLIADTSLLICVVF